MKKSLAYPIIYMTVITAIFIAVLATFNYVTADTIAFNKESELRHKVLYIFDILPKNENSQEIEKIFNERVILKQIGTKEIYVLMEGSSEIAYAIPISGAGLWGSITGFVGLNQDLTKIIGIEFVSQSETPGLGGRISEPFYKEQYRNIDISGAENNNFIIYTPQADSNVDAIAGATQTSSAVVKLINEDLQEFFHEMEVK